MIMRDALPPCRIASPRIDAEGSADDQCGQSLQIHFANPPVDVQVAHYPKQDETVETSIENAVMNQKSNRPMATSLSSQAAMKTRRR